MRQTLRTIARGLALMLVLSAISCGGGGSDVINPTPPSPPPAAANVVPVVVDDGPVAAAAAVNTLYTSVTVCVPGSTAHCQTIDHIQVDTGSYGLRILGSVLTVALPNEAASNINQNALVECTQFVDGYSWGPVALADVQIGGETANSLPVQIIGEPTYPVPATCSSTGKAEDTVATFGANGILGIGVFEQDCGVACEQNPQNGLYYSCSSTTCSQTEVTTNMQVLNPVPNFATDNNGTLIVMPTVAAAGAATVTGSLIFGIDTQTNNASGTQTVLTLDSNGYFTTTVSGGSAMNSSFIDSGSNGLYFDDGDILVCTNSNFANFYCPTTPANLSAVLQAANAATSTTINFSVGNAQTLSNSNPTFTALPTLGGTFFATTSITTPGPQGATFDWGLPFFYGRRVANAIEGHTSSAGTGPYVAF